MSMWVTASSCGMRDPNPNPLTHLQLVHADLFKSLTDLLLLRDTQGAKRFIQLNVSDKSHSLLDFLMTSYLLFIASHDSNVAGLDHRLDTGALCPQQFTHILHQRFHLCCVVKRPLVALCNTVVHSVEDDWETLKDQRHS